MNCETCVLNNACDAYGGIIKKLVTLAVPVTISSVLVSLTRIVDMFMLMNRLGGAEKISVYGSYSTLALPIYNLPSSLVAGIALALVPSITGAVKAKQKERENQLIASGVKLCAVISLPASLGIGVYSRQILSLLFAGETEAIAIAAPLLSMLGVSAFASCLVLVTNSVLQANGKIFLPIVSMLVGLGVKAALAYVLIAVPGIGAMGAPVSTLICNVAAVLVNLWFIGKYTAFDVSLWKILARPMACSAFSLAVSILGYVVSVKCFENTDSAFITAIAAAVTVYVTLLLFGNVLDADEYEMLPFGNKLSAFRRKLKRNQV